jgi:hypothetical protein
MSLYLVRCHINVPACHAISLPFLGPPFIGDQLAISPLLGNEI